MRLLLFFFSIFLFIPFVLRAETIFLKSEDARWITRMIFKNECNLKDHCLVWWNEGENFASLGVGHFIWYPKGHKERFRESFPEFTQHYKLINREIPQTVKQMLEEGLPWDNRELFLKNQNSPQLQALRDFLENNMDEQGLFIIYRFKKSIKKMVQLVEAENREEFVENFSQLAKSRNGLYAMIDYANFKGDGLFDKERYAGQGWGLFQVLQEMSGIEGKKDIMAKFIEAARTVLKRRVENAPPERNEEKWLKGWINRVKTYKNKAPSKPILDHQESAQSVFSEINAIEVINLADLAV